MYEICPKQTSLKNPLMKYQHDGSQIWCKIASSLKKISGSKLQAWPCFMLVHVLVAAYFVCWYSEKFHVLTQLHIDRII